MRGCQKEMILVKTTDSALFESAWFLLREGIPPSEENMAEEANRILLSASRGIGRRHRAGRGFFFLAGVIFGFALFAVFRLLAGL